MTANYKKTQISNSKTELGLPVGLGSRHLSSFKQKNIPINSSKFFLEDQEFQIFYECSEEQHLNTAQIKSNQSPCHSRKEEKEAMDPFNITPVYERISSKIDQPKPYKQSNLLGFSNSSNNRYKRKLEFELCQSIDQPFPTKNKQQIYETTPRKYSFPKKTNIKEDSKKIRIEETDLLESKKRGKKNGEKSLKMLTSSVVEIMKQLTTATYKDIAEKLVANMIADGTIQNAQNRDITNAKRRVYDALNVLISTNILKKEGKFVKWQQSSQKSTASEKLQNMRDQLKNTQQQYQAKLSKLLNLYKKYVAVTNIQQRNQKQENPGNTIPLPFIFATYPKQAETQINSESNELKIKMNKGYKIGGDVEMIVQMGFYKPNPQTESNQIKEIEQYLSKSCLSEELQF